MPSWRTRLCGGDGRAGGVAAAVARVAGTRRKMALDRLWRLCQGLRPSPSPGILAAPYRKQNAILMPS